jgi:hypothetical protein
MEKKKLKKLVLKKEIIVSLSNVEENSLRGGATVNENYLCDVYSVFLWTLCYGNNQPTACLGPSSPGGNCPDGDTEGILCLSEYQCISIDINISCISCDCNYA